MTIYERIQTLPLFQGISQDDLTAIAGTTKFDFQRVEAGHDLVQAGDACTFLSFLLSGSLRVTTSSDDSGYTIIEELNAPTLLQPECIFGLHQRFTHTFTTSSQCNCLVLQKPDVVRIAEANDVFRINLLNIISTQSQRLSRTLWHTQPESLEKRIVQFVGSRCMRPSGEKTILIKMTRLAHELNDSRIDISRALNNLQAQGFLHLSRGRIEIPALEQLLAT